MEQVVLFVGEGLTCTACENRIQRALGQLQGVRQARADHRTGEVRVILDLAITSEEEVRACVRRVGYEVSV